jgi:molybdopterin-containing oxidoreductase family iron-sulfur binding subunit
MIATTQTASRRTFFGRAMSWISALKAHVSTSAAGLHEIDVAEGGSRGNAPKAKWGMAIDLDLCTACGGCVVACASENNVPITGSAAGDAGTSIAWMGLMPKNDEHDELALPEVLPMPCMHCEDAPCVKVCPVNATYQNDEGLVVQIADRCIGCRYCMVACPYSRRFFNWKEPEWPESYKNMLNPDVATRCEGVVEKCSFCSHRIRKLREESRVNEHTIVDADLQRLPACAQSCPANAIVFGDLNDTLSQVSRMAASPRSSRLLEHLGAKPKVFYLARERRQDG